jgi:5-methylcytosine-specific restriction endonuclease McrA
MESRTHLLAGWVILAGADLAGWVYLHHPAGPGLLAAVELVTFTAWPYAVLAVLYCLPACVAALIPRSWREWWRRWHDRPAIPARLRRAVYAADRYACLFCGSGDYLQLDHVRPWSRGGLSSLWNLITLCRTCNLTKSNYWPSTQARPSFYRAWDGYDDEPRAALILAAERRARLLPSRAIRAAWALR